MNLSIYKKSLIFFAFVWILSGCGPSHLEYIGSDKWASEMSNSVLTSGELSYKTKYFLVKNALWEDYENNRKDIIKTLAKFIENPNDKIIPGENSLNETMSAIVELCAYEAQNSSSKDSIVYWLSAAFYSYSYIFEKKSTEISNLYAAVNIAINFKYYNYSLSKIYDYLAKNKLSLEEPQGFPLVLGIVKLSPVKSDLLWSYSKFDRYINGFEYVPKSFQTHNFVEGIGVPIIGLQDYNKSTKLNKDLSLLSLVYPYTFLIKFEAFDKETNTVRGQPEFFDSFNDEHITINDQKISLSKDFSLAIGESLDAYDKINGLRYMFNPEEMGNLQGLYLMAPYNPKKIPVIFIHGLMASPKVWGEMLNTLMSDQKIRDNYQFWMYTYPTGQPIYYSVYQFREALIEIHNSYDPESKNFFFNHTVLIGHSMGGLLARLAIQDSEGNKLLNEILNANNIDDLKLTEKEHDFLKNIGVFEPVPFIGKVILLATPNRGAKMVNYYFARIGSYLITNPSFIKQNTLDIMNRLSVQTGLKADDLDVPTGIDNMAPGSKFLELTIDLPYKNNAEIHTIIANKDKAGEKSGSDGVVDYSSAHLGNAASELVVKSGHSLEFNPYTIKEVARILLEYIRKIEMDSQTDTSRVF